MSGETLRDRLIAAIRDEASHHLGATESQDQCTEDETSCMRDSIHLAWSSGPDMTVLATPERIAELAVAQVAAMLRDEAAKLRKAAKREKDALASVILAARINTVEQLTLAAIEDTPPPTPAESAEEQPK